MGAELAALGYGEAVYRVVELDGVVGKAMSKDRLAEIIVEAIRRDFTDRRRQRQVWNEINGNIRGEVIQDWRHLVVDALSEAEEDERERP